ncbi:DUF6111 family protein [uncultured Roseibium sp.]|uniref:DUF6111 family protein n=1 Tax=uncultured Roseibium sp. TaxID=1936171 RepID=UPI00261BB9F7|nr:DUF6111 family protein [uncultured Roseibium sp.]
MLRVALTHLVLFLLPFFCYAIWLWLTKRSKHPDRWAKGPLAWLTVTGLAFVIVGFLVMSTLNRGPEGSNYRPTQMKDGVFVPGGFE